MAGRNLVAFCDGTSNEVGADHTNVLKLYRCAVRDDDQLLFYDPGVGTTALADDWSPLSENTRLLLGLATGSGIDANIVRTYEFLVHNYRDGDRILLFGFSRGAYTARAVAGMMQLIGLLHPEQANLIGYGLTAYKRAGRQNKLGTAGNFQRVLATRQVPIDFLGVWDSVASVLVPRPDRFYLPTSETLPYTRSNPSVRCFRQAAAIDERRRMFRLLDWRPDQLFRPVFPRPAEGPQDAATLWFAGSHCDVGGGHPEAESQASKFPLVWMARAAQRAGLRLDDTLFRRIAQGIARPGGRTDFVGPDATRENLHDSMRSFWPLFEYVPKSVTAREWPARRQLFGRYLPQSEPRSIATGSTLHRSVIDRMAATSYRPVNLPAQYVVADDAA